MKRIFSQKRNTPATGHTGRLSAPWRILVAAAALVGAQAVLAGNVVQSIEHSPVGEKGVRVVVTAEQPFDKVPANFAIDNPARVVVDLPDTTVAMERKRVTVDSGGVSSVDAVEAAGRSRLVVNLQREAPYRVYTENNQLILTVGDVPMGAALGEAPAGDAVAESPAPAATPAPKAASAPAPTPAPAPVAKTERPAPEPATSAPAPAAPVVAASTAPTGRGNVSTAGSLFKDKNYSGQRVSLNFQDIEVRSVLQLLADFTGLNMVVSDTVDGNITLRLKDVPWDQALDIILQAKGLTSRQHGNVIMVAPIEEVAARERLELEAEQQIEELAPLSSELIQVNYAKAAELSEILNQQQNRILSERGSVTVDERTNTLLVQDTAQTIRRVRGLIGQLDRPVRQVLIESRVVIASDDFARELGVRFGFNTSDELGDTSLLVAGGRPGHIGGTAGFAPGIENPAGDGTEALMVNLPTVLGTAGEVARGGAANILLGKAGEWLLQLELSAMQQEGRGEVISSPRVITSDQQKAVIKQGIEIPYQEATSSGATNVEFKEAVLKLEVTPHITPDDRVIMDLEVSKDNPDFSRTVLGVPPVDTRSVETSVLVDNGETVVLGGVFEETDNKGQEKIPFFGDLPGVGYLFRNEVIDRSKAELLIFVTPKILKESMRASRR